jgi:hypothetical protein
MFPIAYEVLSTFSGLIFFLSPIRATYPTHRIIPYAFTLLIFGER